MADPQRPLTLTGMPGAGKTTVGRALAALTGRPFADADLLFTQRTGVTPAEQITRFGEASFRAIEAELLREALEQPGLVLATGGGAVLRPENRALLRERSTVILLLRPLARLDLSGRPLSRPGVDRLWAEREPLYRACACFTQENREGDPAGTAREILKMLERETEGPAV